MGKFPSMFKRRSCDVDPFNYSLLIPVEVVCVYKPTSIDTRHSGITIYQTPVGNCKNFERLYNIIGAIENHLCENLLPHLFDILKCSRPLLSA